MRVHTLATIAFLALLLSTAAAHAEGPVPDRGAEIALRSGLAIPFGETQNGSNFDQYASTAIPFVVEAGFRADASLFFGARFGYAFPQLKNPNNACTNASCDGSVVTLGLEGIYRINPYQTFAPWFGLGAGYGWTSADASANNVTAGFTFRGFEGQLMAGGDYRLSDKLVIGPALEFAFGRFDTVETRTPILGNRETDVTNTAWHEWLTIGVRGAFGFF
jgi:hypothetical protein